MDRIEQLEAEAAALREALEATEWGSEGYCPLCGNDQNDGHRSNCLCRLALTTDAGRTLLEQVEQLQAEIAAVCSLLYAAGIPSVSEDGYGENIRRLEALLERLRRAEDAVQELLGAHTVKERMKLLALWNESLRAYIPDVEPERGHLSNLYAFISMAIEALRRFGEQ